MATAISGSKRGHGLRGGSGTTHCATSSYSLARSALDLTNANDDDHRTLAPLAHEVPFVVRLGNGGGISCARLTTTCVIPVFDVGPGL